MCCAGLAGRLGPTRYAMRPPQPRRHWTLGGGRGPLNNTAATAGGASAALKLRGRHLLDHEALTCLLVLLFVDDARLNTNRLHRVLRNLCYHGPTRAWIVRALLSMLQKTGVQCKPACSGASSVAATSSASNIVVCDNPDAPRPQSAWLSISLEAALGCRANVFQMQKPAGSAHGKKTPVSNSASLVTIHPQAAPIVCRHVLDTLISLAKSFPSYFLPLSSAAAGAQAKADAAAEAMDKASKDSSSSSGPKTPSSSRLEPARDVDFWELLVRLDGSVGSKKGKSFQKQFHTAPTDSSSGSGTEGAQSFDASPLGQLMSMLAHPVVRRSQQLTDRLLRLLGLVSIGFGNPATATASSSAPTSRQNLPQITRQQPTLASASAPGNTTTTIASLTQLAGPI
jgi:E3 ubiquitin-protein ligase HUWE1